MKIQFNKVTWYSITLALILYIGIFFVGFCFGEKYQAVKQTEIINLITKLDAEQKNKESSKESDVINSANFNCDDQKSIHAIFFSNKVELTLSDKRTMLLPQAISASGARYANTDESFVFWNKGDTAFVNENNITTYKNCLVK